MSKLFPPPAPHYNSIEHIAEMEKNKRSYNPWTAKLAAAVLAILFWGMVVAFGITLLVGGPDPSLGDVTARFIIGAVIAFCFSIPFLL